MGAGVTAGSTDPRTRAHEQRSRSTLLCREAARRRRRSGELCDRLAELLAGAGRRALGDRGESFELRFARLLPMLGFARSDLRRWLEAADVPPETIEEIALAFSEACANAIEHPQRAARQLVEIHADRRGGELELRVRDYGSWAEHRESELRGRGLDLIGRLMDSVEVRRRPDGTEVVMHRSLAGAPAGSRGDPGLAQS